MLTDHLPRIPLAHLPTPLEEMPHLRKALGGGPRLLIKRDDQTGLATGGNKTRKLEFVVADALAQGADTLITAGGPQSNHCRQTAAAAVRAGLRCVLVLRGSPVPRSAWNGNLLLDDLLGAEVSWGNDRDHDVALAEEAEKLKSSGSKPYVIPVGASMPVGAVGYTAAVEELAQQLQTRGETIDSIVFTSGSGGTHAGILTAVKALNMDVKVEGMFDSQSDLIPAYMEKLKLLTANTAAFLGLDLTFSDEDFTIHSTCGGHDYGIVTDTEREIMRLLARTEAVILDHAYNARAMAGMIDQIRKGIYAPDETVLFWHTGGTAGIFAHANELLES